MGTIVRHGNFPFADGEVLVGAELEQDFATIYTEFNGNIDNANIKSGAAIDGGKLAAASVGTTEMEADAITVAKMAAAAVPNVPGITQASLTPGSTSDLIQCWLTVTVDFTSGTSSYHIGFSVDGTDSDPVGEFTVDDSTPRTWTFSYAVAAPSAGSALAIKPRYLKDSGAGAGRFIGASPFINRMVAAPSAGSALAIKPRYLKDSGAGAGRFIGASPFINRMFVVSLLPGK
jgi:hypothetical protein